MIDRTILNEQGICGPCEVVQHDKLSALEDFACSEKVLKDRHIDSSLLSGFLLNDSRLKDAVQEAFGRNLDIWRTNFFHKTRGSDEIGWHQDRHFENSNEEIVLSNIKNHFSILIAITDLLEKDGVVEFIPGSHLPISGFERDLRPFHTRPIADHFLKLPLGIEEQRLKLPLRRGEFAVFHSALIHRSLPFESGRHRVSMVVRLCTRDTIIPHALITPNARMPFN